jgi:hypothetical protein
MALGTFLIPLPYYLQDAVMKALFTTHPELRWMVVAIPSLFVAHWAFTAFPRLLAILPYSLRAILHLL